MLFTDGVCCGFGSVVRYNINDKLDKLVQGFADMKLDKKNEDKVLDA